MLKRIFYNMKKEASVFVVLLVMSVLFASLISAGALNTNTAFVKVSINEDKTTDKSFNIIAEEDGPVNIEVVNIQGVSLKEDSFFINSGESKQVGLVFNSSGLSPGAYFGYVQMNLNSKISKLPIVFEVESLDLFFDVDVTIPPIYLESYVGSKMIIQSNIYDLTFGTEGLNPVVVNVDYFIHSEDGELVYSESDSVVVNKEVKSSKSIQLPKNIKAGMYFITAEITYGNSIGVSTTVFDVSSRFMYFLNGVSNVFFDGAVIIIILIILVGGVSVWLLMYFLRDRDKLFLQMRRSQKEELQQQRGFLLEQQKFLVKEKKMSVKEVRVKVREKIKELKKKQKDKTRTFRKLVKATKKARRKGKKGNEQGLKLKLQDWKSKGYNTTLLNAKLQNVSGYDMEGLMRKWKNQGYK